MIDDAIKEAIGLGPPVDFEIDHTRLIQKIRVPSPAEAITNEPRIFASTGRAEAWFNGSVIERDGTRIMLYRVESKPWFRLAQIASVELDDQFQPIASTNKLLGLRSKGGKMFAEDPRWIPFSDGVLMSYTDSYEMGLANFNNDGDIDESWFLDRPQRNGAPSEKNWAFFEHEGQFLAVYKIVPHAIIHVIGKTTKFVGTTDSHMPPDPRRKWWAWGDPRGGPSPVLHDGLFHHFFHSHTFIGFSPKGPIRHYHVGLYLFEAKSPFKIVGCVKRPLFSADLKEDVTKDRPSHHRVVFPCGAFRGPRGWWLSYGWNDCRIRMRYIDDAEINGVMRLY